MVSVIVVIRGRNGRGIDFVGIQEGVVSSIYRFIWRHVNGIGMASIRVCCHFREGGKLIGLVKVDHVP